MRCKLGTDDYKNREGYAEIDGLIICLDWDIDCQQCLVEEQKEDINTLQLNLATWMAATGSAESRILNALEWSRKQTYSELIDLDELEEILGVKTGETQTQEI